MSEKNEIVIYTTPEGKETFEVNLKKDTVWLSQKQMAILFEKNTDTIGLHIKNIFFTKELDNKLTTEEYSVVQMEGGREVKRKIKFYNLDLIISVGYRVNSKRGTQFRIWATNERSNLFPNPKLFFQKKEGLLKLMSNIEKSVVFQSYNSL